MAMAISNNLDLRVDALDSSLAEADLEESRSIYDPNLSFSVKHGQTFYTGETYGTKDTTGAIGVSQALSTGGSLSVSARTGYTKPVSDFPDDNWTDWYTSVGVTLYQPLLKRFGKETTELNISLADYDLKASIEEFRDAVSDTVYSVIKTYNRLYTLRQALQGKEEALKSARELRKKISTQRDGDNPDSVELANTDYAISQRLKALVDAERAIKDQEAKLRYLMGIEDTTPLIPIEAPSRQEPLESLEEAISLAKTNHPYLKQLELNVKAGNLQEKVAHRSLLPNLAVTASGGLRGLDDRFSDSVDQIGDGKGRWWSAGLQLSMPLGNGAAKSNLKIRKIRNKQLKNRLKASEWKIRNYIEADMRALISARVQIQVAEKALISAQQRLDRYRQRLEKNNKNVQDFLDSESDLIYTRISQTEALENFANAVALFWRDCGILLERQNVNIDGDQPEALTSGNMSFSDTEAIVASTLDERQNDKVLENDRQKAIQKITQKIIASPNANQHKKDKSDVSYPATVATQLDSPKMLQPGPSDIDVQHEGENDNRLNYQIKITDIKSSESTKIKSLIRSTGMDPKSQQGSRVSQRVIRLVIDDFASLNEAKKRMAKLSGSGAGCFILPHGESNYRLYAGSFFNNENAEEENLRLTRQGIITKQEEVDVLLPSTVISIGPFMTLESAQNAAIKLEQLGMAPALQKIL